MYKPLRCPKVSPKVAEVQNGFPTTPKTRSPESFRHGILASVRRGYVREDAWCGTWKLACKMHTGGVQSANVERNLPGRSGILMTQIL